MVERLGGMRISPVEWNFPHLVASIFVWFFCLKDIYLFHSFTGTPNVDLITVYVRVQQIDVWAHISQIKFFTADCVGVSSFGVQRKFDNCCLGMLPLLS